MASEEPGEVSPWVYIPAYLIEGAASDLQAAIDYLAAGDIESARDCLIHPWTVLETAEQAVAEIYDGG